MTQRKQGNDGSKCDYCAAQAEVRLLRNRPGTLACLACFGCPIMPDEHHLEAPIEGGLLGCEACGEEYAYLAAASVEAM